MNYELTKQFVSLLRQCHALLGIKHGEHNAKSEEKSVNRQEGETVGAHILLGVAQTLAGKVFLHHVLIQSSHHYHDKDASHKTFEEVVGAVPVAKLKDP